jgi:hypothetical protein
MPYAAVWLCRLCAAPLLPAAAAASLACQRAWLAEGVGVSAAAIATKAEAATHACRVTYGSSQVTATTSRSSSLALTASCKLFCWCGSSSHRRCSL